MKDFFPHQNKNSNQSIQFDILPAPDYSHWQKCPSHLRGSFYLKILIMKHNIDTGCYHNYIFFWVPKRFFFRICWIKDSRNFWIMQQQGPSCMCTPFPHISICFTSVTAELPCCFWSTHPSIPSIPPSLYPSIRPSIHPSIRRPFLWALTRWGAFVWIQATPSVQDPVFGFVCYTKQCWRPW